MHPYGARLDCGLLLFRYANCDIDGLKQWLNFLLLQFAFNEAKCKGVGSHFYFDFLVSWYAHGDRGESTASTGAWQDCDFQNGAGVRVSDREFWRLADWRPSDILFARIAVVPDRVGRE